MSFGAPANESSNAGSTEGLGELPVGAELPGWRACPLPRRAPLIGRWIELHPLSARQHAAELYAANSVDRAERMWTYLGYGPFESVERYESWIRSVESEPDPLYFAALEKERGRAVGVASYLRIQPEIGSIEIGHLAYSPSLQRTRAASEVAMLLIEHAWELGYRRIEWKCDALNAASRRGAQRLGFRFEGIFRQATIVKGRNRDTAWYSLIDKDRDGILQVWNAWRHPDNFDSLGRQRRSLSSLTAADEDQSASAETDT